MCYSENMEINARVERSLNILASDKKYFDILRLVAPVAKALSGRQSIEVSQDTRVEEEKISIQQVVEMTHALAEQIAPSLALTFKKLISDSKFTVNKTMEFDADVDYYKKSLKEYENNIRECEKDFELYEKTNDIDNMKFLEKQISEYKGRIEERKKLIDKLQTTLRGSEVNHETGILNLKQENSIEDVVVMMHELAHVQTPNLSGDSFIREISSILTEFICENFVGQEQMQGSKFSGRSARVTAMQNDSSMINALIELFEEFERTDAVSNEDLENFSKSVDNAENPMEDFMSKFYFVIDKSVYFIGTASALVLVDEVKNKYELQNVFDLLNRTDLSNMQKMQQLGLTRERFAVLANAMTTAKTQDSEQEMTK